jgi:hypothetical protein
MASTRFYIKASLGKVVHTFAFQLWKICKSRCIVFEGHIVNKRYEIPGHKKHWVPYLYKKCAHTAASKMIIMQKNYLQKKKKEGKISGDS